MLWLKIWTNKYRLVIISTKYFYQWLQFCKMLFICDFCYSVPSSNSLFPSHIFQLVCKEQRTLTRKPQWISECVPCGEFLVTGLGSPLLGRKHGSILERAEAWPENGACVPHLGCTAAHSSQLNLGLVLLNLGGFTRNQTFPPNS